MRREIVFAPSGKNTRRPFLLGFIGKTGYDLAVERGMDELYVELGPR